MEGTFSIIGRCRREDAIGVAVATAAFAVGKRVPHARYGVGAVATQGRTDSSYGSRGLALMEMGMPPESLLPLLIADDTQAAHRQVIMMDWSGKTIAHTGDSTDERKGCASGRECIAAGNTLAGKTVVTAMVTAFDRGPHRPLAERLVNSLQAGQDAGGDRRGATSAALLVVSPIGLRERMGATIDLRVDDHPTPVEELARLLSGYELWMNDYRERLSLGA